jgi:hypothetical protein
MNCEIPPSARNRLAKFGISVEFTDNGIIELFSRQGIKCGYSAGSFCPVIGFGADGRIYVRLISRGIAEFLIDGDKFECVGSDASLRMAVAK